MVCNRKVLIFAVVGLFFVFFAAHGEGKEQSMSEIDQLQATFEQLKEAYNAHDLERLLAVLHEEVVIFSTSSPFPIAGKAAARQAYHTGFTHYEQTTLTPINPQFHVLGDTGIVWGHAAMTLKPKDGPVTTVYTRQTWTFIKVGERWLGACAHVSRLPSGN
jgi:uncharacterized protein (TIGR02246 family)